MSTGMSPLPFAVDLKEDLSLINRGLEPFQATEAIKYLGQDLTSSSQQK